jgi:hypothetical protein
VKRWKVAISLAIVAALVGPLATGTWRLRPGGWHPLPVDERERIAKMATETNNCTHFSPQENEIGKAICTILLSDLHSGGRYESGEHITWRYAAKNLRGDGGDILPRVSRGNDLASTRSAVLGLAEPIAAPMSGLQEGRNRSEPKRDV